MLELNPKFAGWQLCFRRAQHGADVTGTVLGSDDGKATGQRGPYIISQGTMTQLNPPAGCALGKCEAAFALVCRMGRATPPHLQKPVDTLDQIAVSGKDATDTLELGTSAKNREDSTKPLTRS